MQSHLNTLHIFALDSGLLVSLDKTKVMVFNTTPQWVKQSALSFTYDGKIVKYTNAYTYLGVVFNGPGSQEHIQH